MDTTTISTAGIAGDRLRSFFERIERLNEEIRSLNEDKSEVFKEAKGVGYDVQAIKIVLRRRAMDPDDRDEQDTLVEIYERVVAEQSVAEPDRDARAMGRRDGRAGTREHADQWASGEPGHADYEIGWTEGEEARVAAEQDAGRASARAHTHARERQSEPAAS